MQPGIYDISNEEYHASDGISRSAVMELEDPLEYWQNYLSPDREKKAFTKSTKLGSVVHGLVIEREKFYQQFTVCKKVNGATKAGKAYNAEFKAAAGDRVIITEDVFNLAQDIAQAVFEHPKSKKTFEGALFEQSIYWHDEETGLLCKARPDIWNPELDALCDLKTAERASPKHFRFSVPQYGYHIQAAMQMDGVEKLTGRPVKHFYFIVPSTKKPHKPRFYTLPDQLIARGRYEYKSALRIAKTCIEKGRWDLDRDLVIPLDYSDYQLTDNLFYKTTEIYERISHRC